MSSHQHGELAGLKQPDEIDEVFGRAHPNPDRIGCPPHEVLVALARQERPMGDPTYGHLAECSPCYLEVRALKQAADLTRGRMLMWAAAAALIVGTGSAAWFLTTREAGVASGGTSLRAQLDLRPCAVTHGEPQRDLLPLVLPRARLMLMLLLPTGSEPDSYEVEIRDSTATARAWARGDAELRNFVSTLEVAVSLGNLSPGAYSLAVRRDGNDWQQIPIGLE
jgi:hypothetical protein